MQMTATTVSRSVEDTPLGLQHQEETSQSHALFFPVFKSMLFLSPKTILNTLLSTAHHRWVGLELSCRVLVSY